jgi:DNA-binding MarR family transcriptional regulator
MEGLGLISRRENAIDRRLREAVITEQGKMMTDRIDEARERIARSIFAKWDDQDIEDLVRLMRRFADDIKDDAPVAR